ncbi:succinyl-diaminopimelate desuccinylase [Anopheles sinensis]|uniref:Succinyl-diaminopimelate desuccinylase n=1 Tax=Anopheles sinensis TaxID=74873 RepID=A0A084WAQ8_ANOSI|nr:succinyl-diaminopimelate desuccinylase [Anopheles sinensis]
MHRVVGSPVKIGKRKVHPYSIETTDNLFACENRIKTAFFLRPHLIFAPSQLLVEQEDANFLPSSLLGSRCNTGTPCARHIAKTTTVQVKTTDAKPHKLAEAIAKCDPMLQVEKSPARTQPKADNDG